MLRGRPRKSSCVVPDSELLDRNAILKERLTVNTLHSILSDKENRESRAERYRSKVPSRSADFLSDVVPEPERHRSQPRQYICECLGGALGNLHGNV